MTKEEKALLIKDICCRLPYDVEIEVCGKIRGTLSIINVWCLYKQDGESDEIDDYISQVDFFHDGHMLDIENIRPVLMPFSKMTDEQKEEYCQLQQKIIYNPNGLVNEDIMEYMNWCYKNHLDVNGLIPKGLAKDMTNKKWGTD